MTTGSLVSLAFCGLAQLHRCASFSITAPKMAMSMSMKNPDRRSFLTKSIAGSIATGAVILTSSPLPSSAVVYLDPAMYGDQENRVAAVDSLREAVRRAILLKPELAVSFYEMALLDGLSYNVKTNKGGPDGTIVRTVLSSKSEEPYVKNMQAACFVLIDASKALKRKTSVTISDAVAIGGGEAIDSVGGPVLTVQVGRTDAPKTNDLSSIDLGLLQGKVGKGEVLAAFKKAGMTEREMTALLGGLLSIQLAEKTTTKDSRGKSRERGKMGRMSEFTKLTDEDIQAAEDEELSRIEGDEDIYIAESFGTRDQAFGKKVGGDNAPNTFNKVLKNLDASTKGTGGKKFATAVASPEFGWVGEVILDPDTPTTQQWLAKYATSNLSLEKDLKVAFNAVTQLGAEYTGGKYEALLKDRPRKTLNNLD